MPSAEHQAVVEMMWAMRAASADLDPDVERSRANLDAVGAVMPMPDGVDVTAVDAGGVPSVWFAEAGSDSERAVLYFHGGGYTAGSTTSHGSLCRRLAVATGVRVLGVDYRLAPEHPYPAAVDDALAVYRWVLGEGLDPERVVVAGDSAGGGLAAALVLAAREAGEPVPSGAVLISAWTDLTLAGASVDLRAAEDPVCSRENLARNAAAYTGGEDLACPLVSPLFGDLAGFPPLLLFVGTAEVLLDDSLRFAAAADAAGVDVALVVEDDLVHVWPFFSGVPESDVAVDTIGEWVRKRTGA
jgi:acetyl esterase/lipase